MGTPATEAAWERMFRGMAPPSRLTSLASLSRALWSPMRLVNWSMPGMASIRLRTSRGRTNPPSESISVAWLGRPQALQSSARSMTIRSPLIRNPSAAPAVAAEPRLAPMAMTPDQPHHPQARRLIGNLPRRPRLRKPARRWLAALTM